MNRQVPSLNRIKSFGKNLGKILLLFAGIWLMCREIGNLGREIRDHFRQLPRR